MNKRGKILDKKIKQGLSKRAEANPDLLGEFVKKEKETDLKKNKISIKKDFSIYLIIVGIIIFALLLGWMIYSYYSGKTGAGKNPEVNASGIQNNSQIENPLPISNNTQTPLSNINNTNITKKISGGGSSGGGTTCTPQCSGKQCGDDGCSGSCGTCQSGQSCDANQCKNNYIIFASAEQNGTISPSGNISVVSGDNLIFNITPDNGFFQEVFVDGVNYGEISSYTFTNITSNHTISARFFDKNSTTFTIRTIVGAGGSVIPSGNITVSYNSNQTFIMIPNTGYHVYVAYVQALLYAAVNSFTFTNIKNNYTISVTFDIDSYPLVVSSLDGEVNVTPNRLFFNYSENVTLQAIPDSDFTFTGWSGDLSGSDNPVNITINSTKNIRANFYINQNYTISASSGENGSINPSGISIVNYGQNKTYNITPDLGYHIEDVVIDNVSLGGYSNYTFEYVRENHTINASFAFGNYSIPKKPEIFDTTFSLPTNGTTWYVNDTGNSNTNGNNFQSTLNNASLGDVIILDAGANFSAPYIPFKLPAKRGNGWIYIISSNLSMFPEGNRVNPNDSKYMPKIISSGDGNGLPAMITMFGTNHYRFAGIEFVTNGPVYNLILHGFGLWHFSDSYWLLRVANSNEELPNNMIYDRCYLHSTNDSVYSRTGILADGSYIAVVDSYLSNFKDTADADAINVFQGLGPYKIVNNYLEASGENFMSGGTDPAIKDDVPSDIEVRGNYFYKPLKWKFDDTSNFGTLGEIAGSLSGDGNLTFNASNGSPFSNLSVGIVSLYASGDSKALIFGYVTNVSGDGKSISVGYWTNFNNHLTPNGTQNRVRVNPHLWCIKNHFELKNAQRVLVSGNIFENNWYLCGGQRGTSLVLTPRNQNGGANWSVVQDLTYVNNIVRHIGSFTRIAGTDDLHPSEQTKRILIKNNLIEDINEIYDYSWGIGLSTGNVLIPIYNLKIINNLIIHNGTGSGSMFIGDSGNIAENFVFENNIFTHADNGIAGNNVGLGTVALDTYTKNYSFIKNLIINRPGDLYYLSQYYPNYPINNTFVNNISEVGFTDYDNGNYTLNSTSIGKNAGTDGKDLGPDYNLINIATICTLDGQCNS